MDLKQGGNINLRITAKGWLGVDHVRMRVLQNVGSALSDWQMFDGIWKINNWK